MVETAYQGQFNDFALFGRFNRTRFRAILVQRSVRPRFMIKGLVLGQDVVQLLLVKDDHLIQAFTRIEPISRSTIGFCQGLRGAMSFCSRPRLWTRLTKSAP